MVIVSRSSDQRSLNRFSPLWKKREILLFLGADNSNGDVTNPFFNNVRLNDGGIGGPVGTQVGRYGRIQLRYSF